MGQDLTLLCMRLRSERGRDFKFTGSTTSYEFDDYSSKPDPHVFNGGLGSIAVSSVIGAGASFGKTRLGNAWTSTGPSGPVYGADLSAGLFIGRSSLFLLIANLVNMR